MFWKISWMWHITPASSSPWFVLGYEFFKILLICFYLKGWWHNCCYRRLTCNGSRSCRIVHTTCTCCCSILGSNKWSWFWSMLTWKEPLILGIGVGAYSAGRSAYKLIDRANHGQSINPFDNKESFFCWLGIVGTGVSFTAMGATKVYYLSLSIRKWNHLVWSILCTSTSQ